MTPTTKDSNWFTHTSDKPYDRHHYKIVSSDDRFKFFEDFEHMRAYWMQTTHMFDLSHVEVLDITPKKRKRK